MAYERAHRLDDRLLEGASDEREAPEWDWDVPGKQTRTELLERMATAHQMALPRPGGAPGRWQRVAPKFGFGDFRAIALRDVLSRLGRESALRTATLAAADPLVARRVRGGAPLATDVKVSSGAGPRDGSRAARAGRGMWRAAERRAVTLYRRAKAAGTTALESPQVTAALGAIGSGGSLDPQVCRKMERILGVRLDRVRLHTGAVAREAAEAANARAFTVGEDIFFPGYDPHSSECEQTLLHELVHCCQWWQGRIGPSAGPSAGGVAVSDASHPLEQEAERVVAHAFHAPPERGPRGPSVHDVVGSSPKLPIAGAPASQTVPPTSDARAVAPPPVMAARGSTPQMILRKASAGPVSPAVTESASGPSRKSPLPDVATATRGNPTVWMTMTPGAALAMERPHYGEAMVRVTGPAPAGSYDFMVLVSPELRSDPDAAWIFSSLRPVSADIVRQFTSAVQEQAGLRDAEASPEVAAFWLPRTKEGATLYFSAAGVYVVVALANRPEGVSMWTPFVVQSRERNEFEKGVIRGFYSTGALFASGAAAMARAVGAGRVSDRLIRDIKKTLEKQAEKYPAKVQTIDEALTGIGPLLSWAAGVLGQQVSTLITLIIGGGFGRIFAGAVAKSAATYAGKSLGEQEAIQLALKASATWEFRGTFLGVLGTSAELQTGEIYQRLLEIEGLDESQKAVWVALTGGVVGGFLDALVPCYAIARMLGLARPFTVALAKQIAARPELASQVTRAAGVSLAVGKAVGAVGGVATAEGLTEVLQGKIAQAAVRVFNEQFGWMSPEALAEDKENFAQGFFVGGVMRSVVHPGSGATPKAGNEHPVAATPAAPALEDPNVLGTVQNQDGRYEVAPTAQQKPSQPQSSTESDQLRYNTKGGYWEPVLTEEEQKELLQNKPFSGSSQTLDEDSESVPSRGEGSPERAVDPGVSSERLLGSADFHGSATSDLQTHHAPVYFQTKTGATFRLEFADEGGVRDIFSQDPARPSDRLNHIGHARFEIDDSDGHDVIKVAEIFVRKGANGAGLTPEVLGHAIAQLPAADRADIPVKKPAVVETRTRAPQDWHSVTIDGRALWVYVTQHHFNILQAFLRGERLFEFQIANLYKDRWKANNHQESLPRGYGRELLRPIQHALAHAAEERGGARDTYAGTIARTLEESGGGRRYVYYFALPQNGKPFAQHPPQTLPKLEKRTYRIDGRDLSIRLRPVDHQVVDVLVQKYEADGKASPTAGFLAMSDIEALLRGERSSPDGRVTTDVAKYIKRLAWTLRQSGLGTLQVHLKFGVRMVPPRDQKAWRAIVIDDNHVEVDVLPGDFELLQRFVSGESVPQSVVASYWHGPSTLSETARARAVWKRINGALARARWNSTQPKSRISAGAIVRREGPNGTETRYEFEANKELDDELPPGIPAMAGGAPNPGEEFPAIGGLADHQLAETFESSQDRGLRVGERPKWRKTKIGGEEVWLNLTQPGLALLQKFLKRPFLSWEDIKDHYGGERTATTAVLSLKRALARAKPTATSSEHFVAGSIVASNGGYQGRQPISNRSVMNSPHRDAHRRHVMNGEGQIYRFQRAETQPQDVSGVDPQSLRVVDLQTDEDVRVRADTSQKGKVVLKTTNPSNPAYRSKDIASVTFHTTANGGDSTLEIDDTYVSSAYGDQKISIALYTEMLRGNHVAEITAKLRRENLQVFYEHLTDLFRHDLSLPANKVLDDVEDFVAAGISEARIERRALAALEVTPMYIALTKLGFVLVRNESGLLRTRRGRLDATPTVVFRRSGNGAGP